MSNLSSYSFRLKLMVFLCLILGESKGQIKPVYESDKYKADSIRIKQLLDSGFKVVDAQPDKAENYCKKALEIANNTGNLKGVIAANNTYVIVLLIQGKYRGALDVASKSVALSKQVKSDAHLAQSYSRRGLAGIFLGHFQMAANNLLDAAIILERIGSKLEIQKSFNILSIVFTELKDKKKSLEYALSAESLGRSNKDLSADIMTLMQLARARALNNQFEISNSLFDKLLPLVKKKEDIGTLTYTYVYMAELAVQERKYKKALDLYQIAYKLAVQLKIPDCLIYTNGGLARVYYELNDYQKSEYHLLQGISYARKVESENMLRELLLLGSELKEKQNELRDALHYRKEYEQLNARLLGLDLQQSIQRLEAEFQNSVKEREIAQQKLLNAKNQLKISQKDNYIVISIFVIVTLAAFTLLIYFWYRNKQRIANKNLVLLQKEKEMQVLRAMIDGEETERSRLAKDLHDGVGGLLSATKMHLSILQNDQNYPDIHNHFNHTVSMLDSASQEIRMIAHNLAPELLVKFGLNKALAAYFSRLQSPKFKINYLKVGEVPRLESNFELLVYRVIQELINNVIKHAHSNYVLVQMSYHENALSITVEDNGVGVKMGESEGLGFNNLKSRVDAVNGYIEVDSSPGNGTTVFVEFDVKKYIKQEKGLIIQNTGL
ncbi:ATP-binding protein [Pedobacter sp. B4-66]|uniref:tetratricopeptide repeat-containing sensor histidine kinase n=1 Tax=Pedobacter sp. B4-66 TaxID=2817280 RepID=UPI001BD9BB69|nr:ATP-binding protein [Pedobacter sp. B4-66]